MHIWTYPVITQNINCIYIWILCYCYVSGDSMLTNISSSSFELLMLIEIFLWRAEFNHIIGNVNPHSHKMFYLFLFGTIIFFLCVIFFIIETM